jgi:hypothetical protein
VATLNKWPAVTLAGGPSSDDVEEGQIQMNKVACNNLRVTLNDAVNVHQCLDIEYGKRVIAVDTRLRRF